MKKISIVGVEGSGKTVLMSVLGDAYSSPDANGLFLNPVNRETFEYCTKTVAEMRQGLWPDVTEPGRTVTLQWRLGKVNNGTTSSELCEVTMMDFAGEVYRQAFGDKSSDESDQTDVERLREYVSQCDGLLLLINLKDVIDGNLAELRTTDMLWSSKSILDYAAQNGIKTVAIAFTQADRYSRIIEECGGLSGILKKHFPLIRAIYPDLKLFAVSAVGQTVLDEKGTEVPAANFVSKGLGNIMTWMSEAKLPKQAPASHSHIPKILSILLLTGLVAGGAWYSSSLPEEKESVVVKQNDSEEIRDQAEATRHKATQIAVEKKRQDENIARLKAKTEAQLKKEKEENARKVKEVLINTQDFRQKEVAELKKLKTKINIKVNDAEGRIANVDTYRTNIVGFKSHLDLIDKNWEDIKRVDKAPVNIADAKECLRKLTVADDVIAQELTWLKENKNAQDTARVLQTKIAKELENDLTRFKANDYARDIYAEGMHLRSEGDRALDEGNFPLAHKKFSDAYDKFSKAIEEARSFITRTTLDAAKDYNMAGAWQLCVDEANRVLEWEANNAEALKLKEDAEKHLVSSLKIVAKIGDKEIEGVTFNLAGADCKTPYVQKDIRKGSGIGPFNVTYFRNGKTYVGAFPAVTVDWLGLNTIPVVLKEYMNPNFVKFHKGQKGVQLWLGGPYWAETNIGAKKPWKSGYYFWWGGTIGYKRFFFFWMASDLSAVGFKFNENIPTYERDEMQLKEGDWITKDGILAPEHDAARAHWGGAWRIPTKQEFEDMREKCDWSWTKLNGVDGCLVRGRGDYAFVSIFLPATGYSKWTSLAFADSHGYYWSSVPYSDNVNAWFLNINSNCHNMVNYSNRHLGQSVRPVLDGIGAPSGNVSLSSSRTPPPLRDISCATGDTKIITLPGGAMMEMIYVAPGEFEMGSPKEEQRNSFLHYYKETQHRVQLTKGYWLGKYEVTQSQWESVMRVNPSCFKGTNRPVECVSWDDCQEFIQKINAKSDFIVRLPTEAEWEYACRAKNQEAYSGTGELDNMGWYNDNSGNETHPVGKMKANGWGFYDMHGNVKEWCQDRYDDDYPEKTIADPKGPIFSRSRVVRGGSWATIAEQCRSASRDNFSPGFCNYNIGFRLVCSAEPDE